MEAVEVLAVLILVTIIIILLTPMKWMKFAKWLIPKSGVTIIIDLMLITIVSYYVLLDISVVQIAAVTLLVSVVMSLFYIIYANEFIKVGKKILKDKSFWKKSWLPLVIGIYFSVYVLVAVPV